MRIATQYDRDLPVPGGGGGNIIKIQTAGLPIQLQKTPIIGCGLHNRIDIHLVIGPLAARLDGLYQAARDPVSRLVLAVMDRCNHPISIFENAFREIEAAIFQDVQLNAAPNGYAFCFAVERLNLSPLLPQPPGVKTQRMDIFVSPRAIICLVLS